MIRELEVRRRYLSLRHVTRRAVFVSDRTTLAIAIHLRGFVPERVTLETPLVVIRRIFSQWLVRVMTRRAAYLSIVRITLAVEDAVRLKTNVVEFQTLQQREFFSATMTSGAEVLRQLVATQKFGIVNRLLGRFAVFHRGNVLAPGTVARFAAHAVRESVQSELRATNHRTRSMATKATRYLVRI